MIVARTYSESTIILRIIKPQRSSLRLVIIYVNKSLCNTNTEKANAKQSAQNTNTVTMITAININCNTFTMRTKAITTFLFLVSN